MPRHTCLLLFLQIAVTLRLASEERSHDGAARRGNQSRLRSTGSWNQNQFCRLITTTDEWTTFLSLSFLPCSSCCSETLHCTEGPTHDWTSLPPSLNPPPP